jgi:aspartate kinase
VGVVVQKFGGTSVANAERISHVARTVAATADAGHSVCVVVSAMGRATDDLLALAASVSRDPHPRELDMLLSAGECVSIALLSLALHDLGREAVSLTGFQAGIFTDSRHGSARILTVRPERVADALRRGRIAIIAGFQGMSCDADMTTLGRGGSDTTAVAVAAAVGADVCEIYTDVDGVFTADPRVVPGALRLDMLSYDEMLELAASGAQVLMTRSVEYARVHGVRVQVRSSFADGEGTWIVGDDELAERAIVSGVAHDSGEAKVTLHRVLHRPGVAAVVFGALADAGVNVDMIVQNVSHEGRTDISFTVPERESDCAGAVLADVAREIGAGAVEIDPDVGKVSLIGAGMRGNPGVAAEMFAALGAAGIDVELISTSSIRISCIVRAADVERATGVVHDAFADALAYSAAREAVASR